MYLGQWAAKKLPRVLRLSAAFIMLFGAPSIAQAGTTTYTYDELGRLSSAAPPTAGAQYTYDAAGNRTQTTVVSHAPPVAGPASATVAGNSANNPITLNITTGATLTGVAVATQAVHGTATASGTSITYTPSSSYSGSDSFTYTASNAYGTSPAATVTITVNPLAPIAGSASTTVAFNSSNNPIALSLSGGAATSVSVSTGASHGTATASGTSIHYTPTSGYSGSDSFQYTATNSTSTSSPATVTIIVNPAAPVASPVSATVAYNSANNAMPLSASGFPTSVAVSTQAAHGTATANGTSITYTPTGGYSGSDSFAYTATNAGGTSAPATVTITVNPAAPVASPVSATVAYNSANNAMPLSASGFPTSVAVATQPAHGTATASGTSITYTPTGGYSGSDSFTYTATNAGGTSGAATVTITVNPPPPVANAVSQTVGYNSTGTPISLSLSGGATSNVAVYTAPSHGTAAASGTSITYRPTSGYNGSDSFQYTATNVSGTSSPATVTITVNPALPIANAVSQNVYYNFATPITLSLSGGAATSVAVSTAPAHGTATASGTSISYTGASGYSGSDSFQYTASNASGASAPATVTVTVPIQGPNANPSSQTVVIGSSSNPIALNITGGTPTSVSIVAAPSHGTATASGTSITYTPGNTTGSDAFEYSAGNAGGFSYATVSITIIPLPPSTGPVAAAVATNSSNNPITLNMGGVSISSVAVSTAASHGTATASGTSISYTPTAGYSGTDSFAYTATNSSGTSSPGTVSISVGIVSVTIGGGSYQTGASSISFPTNTATVVYGSGSYTYLWSDTNDGDGTWVTGGTGSTFAPSVSGLKALRGCGSSAQYTVTVTDTVTHRTATSNSAGYTANDNAGPGCNE